MEMVPFESSFLAAAGHDASSRALRIHFVDGTQYEYYEVPEGTYSAFLTAPSKGEFYNKYIKRVFRESKVAGSYLDLLTGKTG
jgi:hypothetical protein